MLAVALLRVAVALLIATMALLRVALTVSIAALALLTPISL